MSVFFTRTTFRGRVQGVGFRIQTLDIAKGFDISGFVRNEVDGSVTLEAEGVESEVRAFCEAVGEELGTYIRSPESASGTREPEFAGFHIR